MEPLARSPMSAAMLRRLPAVARGAALDLHQVPGVVLVDVLDHGAPGVWMSPGTAAVMVWVEPGEGVEQRATEARRTVEQAKPVGVVLVVVVREAGVWEHARAWWRWRRWQVRRWAWERRAARRAE